MIDYEPIRTFALVVFTVCMLLECAVVIKLFGAAGNVSDAMRRVAIVIVGMMSASNLMAFYDVFTVTVLTGAVLSQIAISFSTGCLILWALVFHVGIWNK